MYRDWHANPGKVTMFYSLQTFDIDKVVLSTTVWT